MNELWTRTVRFMLLVGPISAISAVCLMGCASTWLVSQVGGRLLGTINMSVIVVVVNKVVVYFSMLSISAPIELNVFTVACNSFRPNRCPPARNSAVVVRSLLSQCSTICLAQGRRVEGCSRDAPAHEMLMDMWPVAT